MISKKPLPSLHDEIISAQEQHRPIREAIVQKWAREVAGFFGRKAPHKPVAAGLRGCSYCGNPNTANRIRLNGHLFTDRARPGADPTPSRARG